MIKESDLKFKIESYKTMIYFNRIVNWSKKPFYQKYIGKILLFFAKDYVDSILERKGIKNSVTTNWTWKDALENKSLIMEQLCLDEEINMMYYYLKAASHLDIAK